MDHAKLETFVRIAGALNGIGITPLLAGSLGLELVTGEDWSPGDIDVFVPGDARGWDAPDAERIHRWADIEAVMTGLGFHLVDRHEHELVDAADVHVGFGVLDTLPGFAGIGLSELRAHADDRARYLLLTPDQYLRLYEASREDGYRADDEGHKDEAKVVYLRALLARRANPDDAAVTATVD